MPTRLRPSTFLGITHADIYTPVCNPRMQLLAGSRHSSPSRLYHDKTAKSKPGKCWLLSTAYICACLLASRTKHFHALSQLLPPFIGKLPSRHNRLQRGGRCSQSRQSYMHTCMPCTGCAQQAPGSAMHTLASTCHWPWQCHSLPLWRRHNQRLVPQKECEQSTRNTTHLTAATVTHPSWNDQAPSQLPRTPENPGCPGLLQPLVTVCQAVGGLCPASIVTQLKPMLARRLAEQRNTCRPVEQPTQQDSGGPSPPYRATNHQTPKQPNTVPSVSSRHLVSPAVTWLCNMHSALGRAICARGSVGGCCAADALSVLSSGNACPVHRGDHLEGGASLLGSNNSQ
jgi:hypothetical protein